MNLMQAIFVILTAGVLAILTYLIKEYGKDKVLRAYEIALILVQGVEQIAKLYGYDGEKKRALVMKELKKKFPKMSEVELEKYLESAVFEMNKSLKEIENKICEG